MYILFPMIFHNEYQLPFKFLLPLLNNDSLIEWLINYFYQTIIIIIACEVLVAFDVTLFCLMNHCSWRLQILIIDIKDLNGMISDSKVKDKDYNKEIKHQIVKICQKHCKTLEYTKEIRKFCEIVIMVQSLIHMIGLGLILRTVTEVRKTLSVLIPPIQKICFNRTQNQHQMEYFWEAFFNYFSTVSLAIDSLGK